MAGEVKPLKPTGNQNSINSQLPKSQTAASENSISSLAYKAIYEAGIASLTAWTFGITSPLGGVIFMTSKNINKYVLSYFNLNFSNSSAKRIVRVVASTLNAKIASLITTSAGFPITVLGGFKLAFATFVTMKFLDLMKRGFFTSEPKVSFVPYLFVLKGDNASGPTTAGSSALHNRSA